MKFLKKSLCLGSILAASFLSNLNGLEFANGIKIGEVDQDSAIVWVRLTKNKERNATGGLFKELSKTDVLKKGALQIVEDVDSMKDAVPGSEGEVMVEYAIQGHSNWHKTNWVDVEKAHDFIHQFKLKGLKPGQSYQLKVSARKNTLSHHVAQLKGSFKTAPAVEKAAPVSFVVTTCGDYPRRDDPKNGHKIYPQMFDLNPDFFVHAGDIEYYDKPDPWATDIRLARYKWNRLYSTEFLRHFHKHHSSYFMKDDHETVLNDSWPGVRFGNLTWEEGLETFREQVPMGDKTYRTYRWGKDLQVWLVEGRDFRSNNNMKDGPEKTIWGEEQKKWFFDSVSKSDATFRVLVSPTPVVGPDRGNKNDNHANKGFTYEGNQIRSFISKQENMFVICGDRHWQYVSKHPDMKVWEFSCGPASDIHAGGYKEEYRNDYHKYLNIVGGFLNTKVDRVNGKARITFNHHAVNGDILNSKSFEAAK